MAMGDAVLGGGFLRDPSINTYPPLFSLVVAPLAGARRYGGDYAVRLAWGMAQLGSLFAIVRLSLAGLPRRPGLGEAAIAAVLMLRFLVIDLNNQNVSLFLWAALLIATSLRESSPLVSGVLVGLGASLKVMPGFALPGLLGPQRRGRFVSGVLAAVAGAHLAAIALLSADVFTGMAKFWLTEVVAKAGGATLLNQSLRAQLIRWLGPVGGPLGLVVGLTGYALVASWICLRPVPSRQGRLIDVSVAALSGMLFMPFVWVHYFILALPIVVASIVQPSRFRLVCLVAFAALGSLFDPELVGRRITEAAAAQGNVLWAEIAVIMAGLSLRRDLLKVGVPAEEPGEAVHVPINFSPMTVHLTATAPKFNDSMNHNQS